jgi:hypothetical protein
MTTISLAACARPPQAPQPVKKTTPVGRACVQADIDKADKINAEMIAAFNAFYDLDEPSQASTQDASTQVDAKARAAAVAELERLQKQCSALLAEINVATCTVETAKITIELLQSGCENLKQELTSSNSKK